MAQVVITIAGRPYRMTCDEGEEAHIEALGRVVDARIDTLRGAFGEIGDQRIAIMAAITLADDLSAAEKKLAALEGEQAARQAQNAARAQSDDVRIGLACDLIDRAAGQIEILARRLANHA